MAKLTLKALTKRYLDNDVIHNLNLDVNHGEIIVVVGPSGCGKSTLLRMIAGLEETSSGSIFIDDKEVNKLEPKDRNIAMVFQNYALYPHMTVYKNMAYGLRRRNIKKVEIDNQVKKTAEILGLTDLLDRKPSALSGGQRQRVAMGRAIVRDPAIFLFDEPLSNLDANLRVQMRLEIRKLQRQLNTTSIYVTHDQVEAMTLADRLVVMNNGSVEQIGTPLEVYQNPLSTFVGGFLGSPPMNFLTAKISNCGAAVELLGGTRLPLANKVPKKYLGKSITLGLRPESIIKSNKTGADMFDLQVELVEPLGAEQLVYGRFPGDDQTLTLRLPSKLNPVKGNVLTLGVMPDSLHIFDKETGRCIGVNNEKI